MNEIIYTQEELCGKTYTKWIKVHRITQFGILAIILIVLFSDYLPEDWCAVTLFGLIMVMWSNLGILVRKRTFKAKVCKILARRNLGMKYSDDIAFLSDMNPTLVVSIFNGDYDLLLNEPETAKYYF